MRSARDLRGLAPAVAAPLLVPFVALTLMVACGPARVPAGVRSPPSSPPPAASASAQAPIVPAGSTGLPSAEATLQEGSSGSSGSPLLLPVPDAPCRIALGKGRVDELLLSWRGSVFASFVKPETAEVRIDATGTRATLGVTTAELELVGEIDPRALAVFPRSDALVDGYLRVDDARFTRLSADNPSRAVVRPRAPSMVRPLREPDLAWPCEQLALGRRPRTAFSGKLVALDLDSDTPLSAAPNGETFATFHPDPPTWKHHRVTPVLRPGAKGIPFMVREERVDSPAVLRLRVFELQRAAGSVKIRLVDDATVAEGWVHAPAVKAANGQDAEGDGSERSLAWRADALRCEHVVPIFLRQADGVVEVGGYKPGARIVSPDKDAQARSGERTVLLPGGVGSPRGGARRPAGSSGSPGTPPAEVPPRAFVRVEALEGCRASAGDSSRIFGPRRKR